MPSDMSAFNRYTVPTQRTTALLQHMLRLAKLAGNVTIPTLIVPIPTLILPELPLFAPMTRD